MIGKTEPVLVDFSAEAALLRSPVGVGERGIAAGTVLWGSGFPYEIGVPPEIVRECEGVVLDPKLNVAGGGGDSGKFLIGGEQGSAMSR